MCIVDCDCSAALSPGSKQRTTRGLSATDRSSDDRGCEPREGAIARLPVVLCVCLWLFARAARSWGVGATRVGPQG